MKKDELREYIKLYRSAEKEITDLDDIYGVRIWDARKPNFYNTYNLLLRKLLIIIFGEENTDLIEDFIFEQTSLTFDQIYDIITNETDKK